MTENYTKVQRGFRILHPILAGYIGQEMSREYKDDWWQEVLRTLPEQARDLPEQGDYAELVSDQGQPHSITMFLLPEGTTVGSRLKLENFLWSLEE